LGLGSFPLAPFLDKTTLTSWQAFSDFFGEADLLEEGDWERGSLSIPMVNQLAGANMPASGW
jgi:hypothetical protein